MSESHQEIKCSVDTCKYNTSKHCTLPDILVGNTNDSAHSKAETECVSFEMQ